MIVRAWSKCHPYKSTFPILTSTLETARIFFGVYNTMERAYSNTDIFTSPYCLPLCDFQRIFRDDVCMMQVCWCVCPLVCLCVWMLMCVYVCVCVIVRPRWCQQERCSKAPHFPQAPQGMRLQLWRKDDTEEKWDKMKGDTGVKRTTNYAHEKERERDREKHRDRERDGEKKIETERGREKSTMVKTLTRPGIFVHINNLAFEVPPISRLCPGTRSPCSSNNRCAFHHNPLTPSLTHSLAFLTHSLLKPTSITHSLILSLTLTHSLTHPLTSSLWNLPHSLTTPTQKTLTRSFTLSLVHSKPLLTDLVSHLFTQNTHSFSPPFLPPGVLAAVLRAGCDDWWGFGLHQYHHKLPLKSTQLTTPQINR